MYDLPPYGVVGLDGDDALGDRGRDSGEGKEWSWFIISGHCILYTAYNKTDMSNYSVVMNLQRNDNELGFHGV